LVFIFSATQNFRSYTMNISQSNAAKLGQVLANALTLCDNSEQRHGVLKARDLICEQFSPVESDAGWKRYLAFSEAFAQREKSPSETRHFDDFTLDNGVTLCAFVWGDRAHFTGSSTGDHSINHDGDWSRIAAHWEGYKANAEQA
jgi:hypothetical protein